VPGTDAIEWNTYPDGTRNPEFLNQLADTVPKDVPVMFLCRSGVRSHQAAIAATQAGWKEAYNILEGFEGDKDANGHRGTLGGWRKAGLPWIQG
jgi:rhodanese-related sulfurtransferase